MAPVRHDLPHQQHDLSAAFANRIVGIAAIKAGDTVLEVGPGLGALTGPLLDAGAKVVAVEIDPKRSDLLRERFATAVADKRLELLVGDALKLRTALPARWRVVCNPPFHHTAALVRKWLLEMKNPPWSIDLVCQREVVVKFLGKDGEHTRSSALLACAGRSRMALGLPREAVTPPSRVDLAVWAFRSYPDPDIDLVLVDLLLERAFAGPHSVKDALKGLATGEMLKRHSREFRYDPLGPSRAVPAEAWPPLAKLLRTCNKI